MGRFSRERPRIVEKQQDRFFWPTEQNSSIFSDERQIETIASQSIWKIQQKNETWLNSNLILMI